MKKINELTKGQEIDLQNSLRHWLSVGLDTKPVNPIEAEKAIGDLYTWGGLKKPEFLHFSSPIVCELFLNLIGSVNKNSQLWSQLGSQLWSQLRSQLESQLRSQLGSQLESQLRSMKLNFMGTWFVGQQDSYWIGTYDFSRSIGVKYNKRNSDGLDVWKKITGQCHWFYPFHDFCLVSDKPAKVHLDNNGNLHNEHAPALLYRDGYGLYRWHGVEVPPRAINNIESYTPQEIFSERNIEVKRALMSLYGWSRIIPENAVVIDEHPNPLIGRLIEFRDTVGQKYHVVECFDPAEVFSGDRWGTYNTVIGTRTSLNSVVKSLKDTYPLFSDYSDEEFLEAQINRT